MKEPGRIHVCICGSSLGAGGAEKVISLLANELVRRGHVVTILGTNASPGVEPFFELSADISYFPNRPPQVDHGIVEGIKNNCRRIKWIRRRLIALRPDIVVSFLTTVNVRALLANVRLRIPVIVCERNNPHLSVRSGYWRWLRNVTYTFADRVVVQTQGVFAEYPKSTQKSMVVLPNPLLKPVLSTGAPGTGPSNSGNKAPLRVMAMGRLVPQKGFDVLLSALAHVQHSGYVFEATVYGEGPLRTSLLQLRDSLGLKESVSFPGKIPSPWDAMRSSDLFVLSSRAEGFPNVLLEAMASGMASIATSCPFGPSEILTHGVDGLLVPSEEPMALADAIKRLLRDPDERERLGKQAAASVQKFSVGPVVDRWESLLTNSVRNGAPGGQGG